MSKNPVSAPTPDDIDAYLQTSTADFEFELECHRLAKSAGYYCCHGGSYVDPVTGISRQFDIRAFWDRGQIYVACAIECKRITLDRPVLISCVPRERGESHHRVLVSAPPGTFDNWQVRIPGSHYHELRSEPIAILDSNYRVDEPVGKNARRLEYKNGIVIDLVKESKDKKDDKDDLFPRWAQALASCAGLVKTAVHQATEKKDIHHSVILPIVVVPNGTLWQDLHDKNGARVGQPRTVDRCSFFVGHQCATGDNAADLPIILTHVEFVTTTGLVELLNQFTKEASLESWIPEGFREMWRHGVTIKTSPTFE